jgi:Skp family chaperone for outer membrane proteins
VLARTAASNTVKGEVTAVEKSLQKIEEKALAFEKELMKDVVSVEKEIVKEVEEVEKEIVQEEQKIFGGIR